MNTYTYVHTHTCARFDAPIGCVSVQVISGELPLADRLRCAVLHFHQVSADKVSPATTLDVHQAHACMCLCAR
eukprot:m.43572 g.43572  ORF g.43572 m.43572 type:complete len:73 (-) comp10784_c0_seq1:1932-2150(-)